MKPIRPLKDQVRILTAAAAAFLLVWSSAYSQQANPFAKFSGNWLGNGVVHLSNGTKERIRCRAGYIPADMLNIVSLKVELRCAGDSYKFELVSELNYDNGMVSGTWSENSRGVNGKLTGKFDGENIVAVAESQTFNATLELINLGDKQQIRITSPGSEMTDVLIGSIRTSGAKPPQQQPSQ